MTLYRPDPEMVGTAWVAGLDFGGLVSGVASTLPVNWASTTAPVYVQVTVPGGIVNRYAAIRQPAVQIDAWAAEGLLGEVAAVSEMVRAATYDGSGIGVLTTLAGFALVDLTDVSTLTEPRQIRGDPAALARSSQIVTFTYTVKE